MKTPVNARMLLIGFVMLVTALASPVRPAAAVDPLAVDVTAGAEHTCALTSTGGVKCWGNNGFGSVGDGTTVLRTTPVDVVGLTSGVVAISAGDYHTCALTSSGGVKCWGYNAFGQLGDDSHTNRLTPVDVQGMTSGVLAMSAGGYHGCAIVAGNALKCWGENGFGQLGDSSLNSRPTPVNVVGLSSGVQMVSGGLSGTCALVTGGGAKCWGDNDRGAIGNGTTTDSAVPLDVSGLTSGVAFIDGGRYHTCAITTGGAAKCWGDIYTGDGTTQLRLTPVDVLGLNGGVKDIDASPVTHTCAVIATNGVRCWGTGLFGALGNGSTQDSAAPADVFGLNGGASRVATGTTHSCAVLVSGGIKCWGTNDSGQLGDSTLTKRLTPVDTYVFAGAGTPPPGVPPAPSNVSLSNVTQTGLNVNFIDNALNETSIDIERAPSSTGPWSVLTSTGALPGADPWYYPVSGLSPGTLYCFRLRAHNASGDSFYSNVACATTSGLAPPAVPSNVVLGEISNNTINVHFQDNATNETGVDIERAPAPGGPWGPMVTSNPLPGTQTWYWTNTGLTPATQYCYRLRARNNDGVSPYADPVCAITSGGPGVLPPPSGVVLGELTSNSVNVHFTDNATNETGVDIERSGSVAGPWSLMASSSSLPGTQPWYWTDASLAGGTQYCYRLRTRGPSSFSDYTTPVCGTTPGGGSGTLAAPSGVLANPTSSTAINVSFQDNATSETGIDIERGPAVAGPWSVVITTNPLPGTQGWYWPNSGLTPNTQYCYRLRAKDGATMGPYSNLTCAMTPP